MQSLKVQHFLLKFLFNWSIILLYCVQNYPPASQANREVASVCFCLSGQKHYFYMDNLFRLQFSLIQLVSVHSNSHPHIRYQPDQKVVINFWQFELSIHFNVLVILKKKKKKLVCVSYYIENLSHATLLDLRLCNLS